MRILSNRFLLLITSIIVFLLGYYFMFFAGAFIYYRILGLKSYFELSWGLFEHYQIFLCTFYILISFTLYVFFYKKKVWYLFYGLPFAHLVYIVYFGVDYIRNVNERVVLLVLSIAISFFMTKIFVDFFLNRKVALN
jgi:hypothetical protein